MAVANWTVVVRSFVCGASGAAAENHDSNVNPTAEPRSQISDATTLGLPDISVLSYGAGVRLQSQIGIALVPSLTL